MFNQSRLNCFLYPRVFPFFLLLVFFILNYIAFRDFLFTDHDVVIYSIIGKAIYNSFSMPYSYVFDHKPIMTYYVYGAIQYLLPLRGGYFILSLFCILISFFFISKIKPNKRTMWKSFYILIFMVSSLCFIGRFSGNTETVLMPMMAIFLYFACKESKFNSFFIGFFISLSVNINYLSFVIFFLPTLVFIIFNKNGFFLSRLFLLTFGFVFGCILIFLPFFISGESIVSYFKLQYFFLSVYHESEYKDVFLKFIIYFSIYSPILYSYIKVYGVKNYNSIISLSLYFSAIASAMISGRPYDHYFVFLIIPISFMLIQIIDSEKLISALNILFLFLLSLLISINYYHKHGENGSFKYNENIINRINYLSTDDNTALNIKSSHVIFNYTKLRSIGKYVFPGHVSMFYNNEDDYYITMINKKPKLIMTSVGLCNNINSICDAIRKSYYFDEKSSGNDFDLYIRK